MSKSVEDIEQEISRFTPEQLAQFRAWFEAFDAEAWERQLEQDAMIGRPDYLTDIELGKNRSVQ